MQMSETPFHYAGGVISIQQNLKVHLLRPDLLPSAS
jgi:hypothetical protein